VVEETGTPGDLAQVTDKLYHIIKYILPSAGLMMIGTDYIGSCKVNYNTITTTMACYMQVMKFRWNYMNEHLLYNFWLNDSITYFSDYMRTGTAFGIIAITVMLIGHMFAFYALRRPRYIVKRLTALIHFMTGKISSFHTTSVS
jgi:hypothetical protein